MGIIARQSIKASLVSFVGVFVGGFTTLFLLPKFVSPEDIGLINTIQKIALLLSPFMGFGAAMTIKKYFSIVGDDDDDRGLVYTNFILLVVTTIIFGIVYVIFMNPIGNYFNEHSPLIQDYLWYPLVLSIAMVGFHFVFAISNVKMRITVPSFINNTLNRVFNVFAILAYHYFSLSLSLFVLFFFTGFYFIPFFLVVIYVFYFIKPKLSMLNLKGVVSNFMKTRNYSFFLVFSSVSGVLVQSIDSIMLSSSKGLVATGIYTIAFYMANIIDIPVRMLANISFPILSAAYENGDFKKIDSIYKKSSSNQFLIGFLVFSLVWFNAPAMFEIIPNGNIYSEGLYVILFIGLGKLFDMALGVNRQIIEVSSFYKYNLFINILLSILVIVFNIIFIEQYGVVGAALSTLIAMVLSNILALVIVYLKTGLMPFETKTLKFIFIGTLFFLSIQFMFFDMTNPFLSIFVKSSVISVFILLSAYLLKISDEMNQIVNRILKK